MAEAKPISRDWKDLTSFYLDETDRTDNSKYNQSLDALGELCSWISSSDYAKSLFAFTSHHRLNVFQRPPTYPECLLTQHLNLNPTEDGLVEFTFVDTFNEDKQWKRSAKKDDVCRRLEGFMLQVGWVNYLTK